MFVNQSHKRPTSARKSLSFDQLEARVLMAGNVTASLDFGELQITGDAGANQIRIVSDGTNIRVEGIGTKINGARGPFTVAVADVQGMAVDMGAGNDQVTLLAKNTTGTGFDLGSLTIDTGAGNDQVTLQAKNRGEGFSAGFSALQVEIVAGTGNDKVNVVAANEGESTGFLFDNLAIQTEEGKDKVSMNAKNASGNGFNLVGLSIDTGADNDELSLLARNGGGGTGFLFQSLGFVELRTSTGKDLVNLTAANTSRTNGFNFQGFLDVSTAEGNDTVKVTKKGTGDFVFDPLDVAIDGGTGVDRLTDAVFRNAGSTVTEFEK